MSCITLCAMPPWGTCRRRPVEALMLAALAAAVACGGPPASAPDAEARLPRGAPPVHPPGPPERGARARETQPVGAQAPSQPARAAEPRLLRCPARDSADPGKGWVMDADSWVIDPEGRLCCTPRHAPTTSRRGDLYCFEKVAPALAEPSTLVIRRGDAEILPTHVPFELGSARMASMAHLDFLTKELPKMRPDAPVFLTGATRRGETASDAADRRLVAERVSAVRRELERRGVPASRIVEQDEATLLCTRFEFTPGPLRALLDSPVVLTYSTPLRLETLRDDRSKPEEPPCVPGAIATRFLPAAELEGDILRIEACHAGACAAARLALDTLGAGDKVVLALEGRLSAAARLTWEAPGGFALTVHTTFEDGRQLASGEWFSLRVQVDDEVVARLEEALLYTRNEQRTSSGLECRKARVPREVEAR
ncbi:hypothetical protein [Sorangium sp. So ce1335]|uniref:hypothetical protein n=1 Tax=Sorangium sp. So ce1335 TaxID=3133335 RepID=UPI003F634E44